VRTETVLIAAGGMRITWPAPTGPDGTPPAAAVAPPVAVSVSPQYGVSNTSQLSALGVQAMTAAVNTYIAGLSAAQLTAIAGAQPDGGLSITVTPRLVTVPCLYINVSAVVTLLGGVVSVGANREAI
jgi:hypothetical protein